MSEETPMFAVLLEHEEREREEKAAADRVAAISRHRESLKTCWPEWNGPKVDPESVHGYCEVGTCIVRSITHGEKRYHYMAPCRITGISEDGETIEAEIEYRGDTHCRHYNGERLRLDITEVWAPVGMLNAERRSA